MCKEKNDQLVAKGIQFLSSVAWAQVGYRGTMSMSLAHKITPGWKTARRLHVHLTTGIRGQLQRLSGPSLLSRLLAAPWYVVKPASSSNWFGDRIRIPTSCRAFVKRPGLWAVNVQLGGRKHRVEEQFAPWIQVVFPNVLLRDSDIELFEDNPLE